MPKTKVKLFGQDRRMFEAVLKILDRADTHDARIAALPATSRRSRIFITDPTDSVLATNLASWKGRLKKILAATY